MQCCSSITPGADITDKISPSRSPRDPGSSFVKGHPQHVPSPPRTVSPKMQTLLDSENMGNSFEATLRLSVSYLQQSVEGQLDDLRRVLEQEHLKVISKLGMGFTSDFGSTNGHISVHGFAGHGVAGKNFNTKALQFAGSCDAEVQTRIDWDYSPLRPSRTSDLVKVNGVTARTRISTTSNGNEMFDSFSPRGSGQTISTHRLSSDKKVTRKVGKAKTVDGNTHKRNLEIQAAPAPAARKTQVQSATLRLMEELPDDVRVKVDARLAENLPRNIPAPNLTNKANFWLNQLCTGTVFAKLFMNLVIISNTIILGFEANSNWGGWLVFDSFYAAVFVLEQLVVFYWLYHSPRRRCDRNEFTWYAFDLILAALAVMDVTFHFIALAEEEDYSYNQAANPSGNASLLRFARLIRLTRIIRLLKLDIFKDLVLMINGALGGLRTLGWSIFLITVPVYAFALVLTETVGKTATGATTFSGYNVAEHFSTVSRSMFTGFRCLVLSDCNALDGTPIFPHLIKSDGWGYGFGYCLVSVCMSFGLFNVIIAIYVENTVAAAKSNDAVLRQRRLDNHARLAEQIYDLAYLLWQNFFPDAAPSEFVLEKALEMEMSHAEFQRVVVTPDARALLTDMEVPYEDHRHLFEICDADDGGILTIDELVAGVKKLRGDPRRSDIVFVMLRTRALAEEVQSLKETLILGRN